LIHAGQELVVSVDFMLNRFILNNALRSHHLLDLKEHRIVILENKAHHRTALDATMFFQLDNALPIRYTHLLISRNVQNLRWHYRTHKRSIFELQLSTSRPYARARTSTGCTVRLEVPCVICRPASEQSVAIVSAPESFTPRCKPPATFCAR